MKVEIDNEILKAVKNAEDETGFKCYLVGGFIRNKLLGYESEDIDFVIRRLAFFCRKDRRDPRQKKNNKISAL